MPFYEYRCSACRHEESFLESIKAPAKKKCPQCGKRAFERLMSAAGFQLKGDGWYVTDFKNKDKGAKGAGAKDKAGAGDKAEKAGADAKDSAGKTDKADKSADKSADKKSESGGGGGAAK